ncbi:MAG: hypothetical protein IJE08_01850 [Clostridia bacterium]|nr:hypothetical protein [Clostridia bacterium]
MDFTHGNRMNRCRISKYSPEYRQNGIYTKEEWTNICDVGKSFEGIELTMCEYERVEYNYLRFVHALCQACGIQKLAVAGLEEYGDDIAWSDGMILDMGQTGRICRDILREKCWCRLEAEGMRIRFGYEYYLHVECALSAEEASVIASEYELYAEPWYEEMPDDEEE